MWQIKQNKPEIFQYDHRCFYHATRGELNMKNWGLKKIKVAQ